MEENLFGQKIDKGAILSNCRSFRYKLWRVWDAGKPQVCFIMLNPSTADADHDDPTIRRCISFARSWGYGSLIVCNLFAFRATSPKELLLAEDPFGVDNVEHIQECINESEMIVAAWGNSDILQQLKPKTDKVNRLFIDMSKVHYLEKSKDGTPKHPLYLPKYLKPIMAYPEYKGKGGWGELR